MAQLPCGLGCEQGGTRPVLIIQNNMGNRYSPLVIVAPITAKVKRDLPTHIRLKDTGGLLKTSTVLLEQPKSIDKTRLIRKLGHLSPEQLKEIDRALAVSLKLEKITPMILTLCAKCRNQFNWNEQYRIWRVNPKDNHKDICTYCGVRLGFDYFVKKKNSCLLGQENSGSE